MNSNILPYGSAPDAVPLPWFPTRFQAVIFRNWNIVSPERIAAALNSQVSEVLMHAEKMGLPVPPEVPDAWLKRGYVSIIRTNWQLLNYDAVLRLLDWNERQLADVLQNEDFLWIKLGSLKPMCPETSCRALTEEEEIRTAGIRKIVEKYPFSAIEMPFAFIDKFSGSAELSCNADGLFIAYSYSALYGDSLVNPELDPYPDKLLQALAAKGINAVWIPGVLYQLHYFKDAPQLSLNWEKRIESLNALVKKAAKYGMKIFLYLNEPRGLPIGLFKDDRFIQEKYLEVEDLEQNLYSMCTSKKAVLEYLDNAVKELFSSVPGLGGAFLISNSEYLTHCNSRCINGKKPTCPRCAGRPTPEIITEVITTIAEAAGSVDPDAQIIGWDWAWDPEWISAIAPELPKNVAIMTVSESHMPVEFDGVKTIVRDYSLSHHGLSQKSMATWKVAADNNLKRFAKIQISCTWEGSAVPYIPVTGLVDEHLAGLRKSGIKNYVTNWTLGGYPSINMDLLKMTHDEMVVRNFGEKAFEKITSALKLFSEAFRNFPFDLEVLYNSPHNIGPANLLYPQKTNYKATMVGIPYDDLQGWLGPYPAATYCTCLQKLCKIWRQGLDELKLASSEIAPEFRANYEDLASVAEACYCNYASAANQAFYIAELRESGKKEEINKLLAAEISLAARQLELSRRDSRLGFEATNHYAYTLNELLEKIINCEYIREQNNSTV